MKKNAQSLFFLILGLAAAATLSASAQSIPTISPWYYFGGGTSNIKTVSPLTKVLVGASSTTTNSFLEVNGTTTASVYIATSTTATSTFANGLNATGGCIALNGTCLGGGSGTVTSVTGTWPIISSGGTAPNITFDGLSTSTAAVVGNIPYFSGVNTFANVASSSLSVSSPLTVTGTLGALLGGSASTINCQAASGSQAGCLASADWTTFNNKVSTSRQLTVAGTANQITSSAGAQDLSADRTWTLSLPSHVIFPSSLFATSASTTNATTTNLHITDIASGNCLQSGANGLVTSTGSACSTVYAAVTAIGPTGQTADGPTVTIATSTSAAAGITSALTVVGSGDTLTFTPSISGTLTPIGGGTGIASYTAGDLLYATGLFTLAKLAVGVPGTNGVLGVVSGLPAWVATSTLNIDFSSLTGQADLTTQVTGVLPIATGGTNASSFGTTNGVVYFDGTRLVNDADLTFNGTTLTATNASIANLTVNTSFSDNTDANILGVMNVGNGTATTTIRGGTATSTFSQDIDARIVQASTGLQLDTLTAGSALFATTGGFIGQDNANFFWDDTNNFLGLGTNSPLQTLTVRTDSGNTTISSENPQVALANLDPTNGNFISQGYALFNGVAPVIVGLTGSLTTSHTAASEGADMFWATRNAGTLSEKMRLSAGGNLGIGTTSPNIGAWGNNATVQTIEGPSAASSLGVLELSARDNTTAEGTNVGALTFTTDYNTTNRKELAAIYSAINGTTNANNYGGQLKFYTKPDSTSALTQRMTIDNAGKVGIGTTTPTLAFQTVFGATASPSTSGPVSAGTAAFVTSGESLTFGAYSTGRLWMQGQSNGNAATNRDIVMQPNGGNVGIGTSTPDHMLTVYAGNLGMKSSSNGNNGILRLYDQAGVESGQIYPHSGDMRMFSAADILLLQTGKVGIGTTTPNALLTVQGAVDANNGQLKIMSPTVGSEYAGLTFFVGDNSPTATNRNWQIANNYSAAGNLDFLRSTSVTGNPTTNVMSLDSSGNVGIGSTTPTTALSVVKTYADEKGQIMFGDSTTENTYGWIGGGGSGIAIGASNVASGFGIAFETGTGAASERMRITDTGAVGIGTSTPQVRFSVSNTGSSVPMNVDGGGSALIGISKNGAPKGFLGYIDSGATGIGVVDSTGTAPLMMVTNAGRLGVGTTTPWRGLSVTGTVAFDGLTSATGGTNNDVCISSTTNDIIEETTGTCVVSSKRYKKDIGKLTVSALDMLSTLKPSVFRMKEYDQAAYSDQLHYGFIAEDLAATDPHLVRYGTDGLPRSIDDHAVMAVTVQAVQELRKENTMLKNKLQSLEARLLKLEKK